MIALLLAAPEFIRASENPLGGLRLQGADGTEHRFADYAKARAIVLLFLATDCPISNRYSPLLHSLEAEYRTKNVQFLAVFSGAPLSAQTARTHLKDFGLEMPGLLDPAASLARQTGARVTPEALVFSPAGEVLYRGRIDNRYVAWGRTRPEATRQDLREALEAILSGKRPASSTTKALGCAIPGLGGGPEE